MTATTPRRPPRRRPGAAFGFAVLLGGGLLAATPAEGYVRYRARDGSSYAWPVSCVHITGYPNDFPDMTAGEVETAAREAAHAWGKQGQDCTYLDIKVQLSSEPTPRAVKDFANSLIFRHADWCAPGDPPGQCSYAEAALAITTVFTSGKDGSIEDADIEVNDRYFKWGDLETTPDSSKTKQDLQNALTHEMGHLIGLDHTCFIPMPSNNIPPIDNAGNPIPTCASAPPAVRATTMFASATPGDVSKRSLEADDKQAVCDIYPLSADPVSCPASLAPPHRGCALAGGGTAGGDGAALATGALAAALVLGRRRHARRRRVSG